MSFTAHTSFGVDIDWLLPGLRGGNYTILGGATASEFFIQYDMDGQPGQGLIVRFVSNANNFTYGGTGIPNGGTSAQIELYDGATLLATTNGNGFNIADFASAGVENAFYTSFQTLTGNAGNDILHGYGNGANFIGNGGNDSFVIEAQHSFTFRGSASDGSGGLGEINGIVLRTGFVSVNAVDIFDIDALTFDHTAISGLKIFGAPSAGGLSSTLAVTGDTHANTLQFASSTNPFSIDLSGLQFFNWTAGVDKVEIGGSAGADAIHGSSVNDTIDFSGGLDIIAGNGGDDLMLMSQGYLPAAVHGSAADGTGGGDETDLIGYSNNLDLTAAATTFTHIDGFRFLNNSGNFNADFYSGAISNRSNVLTLGSAQIGTSFSQALVIDGGATAAIEIVMGASGALDASLWSVSGLSSQSRMHITGSSGNDAIAGWQYADSVTLGGGADTVNTLAGDDQIFFDHTAAGGALDGGNGTDTLVIDWRNAPAGLTFSLLAPTLSSAGPGGMTITGLEHLRFSGSAETDTVNGGDGHDYILGEGGDDSLNGGMGNDNLFGGEGEDTLDTGLGLGTDSLNGDGGNDMLTGRLGGGADVFDGGAGTDLLVIDRGDISGSFSLDLLDPVMQFSFVALADGSLVRRIEQLDFTAGSGNDTLSGGNLADILRGNGGRDFLSGRDGADSLFGGAGLDIIDGGNGDDLLDGGAGIDLIDGGDGDDIIDGGDGDDTLDGGANDDVLRGGAGNDRLSGGDGNDSLAGGAGGDSFDGGDGYDIADFAGSAAGVGIDRNNALGGFGEGYGDSFFSIEEFVLSAQNDVFQGNGEAEIVRGGSGNDALDGGDGDDTLNGGNGNDTMNGGGGDDFYFVDNINDVVIAATGAGADRVLATASYALLTSAEIELFTTTDPSLATAIDLTGNNFVQTLVGNAGANRLDGRGGADIMNGMAGDDFYFVDNAADVVIAAAGAGNDRVLTWTTYALAAAAEIELFTTTNQNLTTAIDLTGNNLAQTLVGNAGANRLDGRGGADIMNGMAGDDLYFVDNAGDTVIDAAAGAGTDRVLTSTTYALAAAAEIELFTTINQNLTTAIDLTGNNFAQTLIGNASSNILTGKGGSDTMNGMAGDDSFVFDTALGAGNVDSIIAYNVADDTIRLENQIFSAISSAGTLSANQFVKNTSGMAQDADDRIVYETDTGKLLYDADGSLGGGGIQFATLNANLALTNADFFVI